MSDEREPPPADGQVDPAPAPRSVHLRALIARGAREIRRLNLHIGAPAEPYPEALQAELERDMRELERVWDAMERQRGGPAAGSPAAEAVDADRGEGGPPSQPPRRASEAAR